MIACTICGRSGAQLCGLFRHCHSACVCAQCWDGLARSVLAEAEADADADADADAAWTKDGTGAHSAWITRTLASVARSSSTGH